MGDAIALVLSNIAPLLTSKVAVSTARKRKVVLLKFFDWWMLKPFLGIVLANINVLNYVTLIR